MQQPSRRATAALATRSASLGDPARSRPPRAAAGRDATRPVRSQLAARRCKRLRSMAPRLLRGSVAEKMVYPATDMSRTRFNSPGGSSPTDRERPVFGCGSCPASPRSLLDLPAVVQNTPARRFITVDLPAPFAQPSTACHPSPVVHVTSETRRPCLHARERLADVAICHPGRCFTKTNRRSRKSIPAR